jgi:Ca2+-binding EF-hand superfamily protein
VSGGNDGTIRLWDISQYVTPTSAPTPDFDGDGIVGVSDFLQFVDQFGFSQGDEGYDERFDLDGDGVIGIGDFLIFVDDFGKKVSS